MRLVRAICWMFVRWLLRRRYAVEVVGLEKLRGMTGPTLVLPNHPGYNDPPLVLSHVRWGCSVRPVVTTSMYRRPLLFPLMRLVEALEVPDLSTHSVSAKDRTLAMIDAMVAGLQRGESFLIYPSGHVYHSGEEIVGAARAVSEVLARFPAANIVLVRTRGLWGSMFTYAPTGKYPDFARALLRALGWFIAGLIFFVPKRRVVMTIQRVQREQLPGVDREQLNPFLEAWYNQEGPESPSFVPWHAWFGPRSFHYPQSGDASATGPATIRKATREAVRGMIEDHLGRPLSADEQDPQTTLDALGLDSLDRMDLALSIEDRFGFRSPQVANSVGELEAVAEGLVAATDDSSTAVPAAWLAPPRCAKPVAILAENLPQAFVERALADPRQPCAADRISGVVSYRRMLVGAAVMADRFRKLPGEAVGLLLPASVAADTAFFGLHLAGKLPVMLNWTTGPGNLAHAVEKTSLTRVVTSRKLIDRLGIVVPGAEFVFVEDLRASIGKIEVLWAMLAARLFPRRWLRRVPRPDPDKTAVVLFTSGSENVPKAVPLSHRNLIANVRAAVELLPVTNGDRLLGFLPPFHSFGLTGNVLLSIMGGLRVVHYADPTHAAGLLQTVKAYGATLLITTPTFLGYLFALAKPEDMQSLRFVVSGAEKCPEAVFAQAARLAPQAVIIEGYGITECSPVVAGNRWNRNRPGTIGQPVRGVEICVVDPESHAPLPGGATGMLLVRGPSVFDGYLAYDGPDPFAEVDGRRWYVTGDLVQVDAEGFLHFRGRLKRFLKAGGEMISLPALEEPFVQRWPATETGPQVAVEGVETPGGRHIALFTTRDIALREANALLAEAGFRGVMRLDEVRRVEAIPVLGTGKTDYKLLRGLLAEAAHDDTGVTSARRSV